MNDEPKWYSIEVIISAAHRQRVDPALLFGWYFLYRPDAVKTTNEPYCGKQISFDGRYFENAIFDLQNHKTSQLEIMDMLQAAENNGLL